MEIKSARRNNAKIKMALQGPSGSGKTYSSLLLAKGLANEWSKIVIIDTENQSSNLYAHLGNFKVLHLEPPFSPERYIDAIKICESEGFLVIIIDSISHEWAGLGGILDLHAKMQGNTYTNWSKLTPRHNAFVQCMLQSPVHIIGTIRSKQDYVIVERNGKHIPEKVGMKGIVREGIDYEFTLLFTLDMANIASVSKDRTSLFISETDFRISEETGKKILSWCNSGSNHLDINERINACKSIDELLQIYYENPDPNLKHAFADKKEQLKKL